jgi:hypothetical protein
MSNGYKKCGNNAGVFQYWGHFSCNTTNDWDIKLGAVKQDLYNQCVAQDK